MLATRLFTLWVTAVVSARRLEIWSTYCLAYMLQQTARRILQQQHQGILAMMSCDSAVKQ